MKCLRQRGLAPYPSQNVSAVPGVNLTTRESSYREARLLERLAARLTLAEAGT